MCQLLFPGHQSDLNSTDAWSHYLGHRQQFPSGVPLKKSTSLFQLPYLNFNSIVSIRHYKHLRHLVASPILQLFHCTVLVSHLPF